jgi:secreted PhoX family phosphatase
MKHDEFEEREGLAVNPSTQPAIAQVIDLRLSRRTILKGMAGAGAFGLFGCSTMGNATPLSFTEVGRTTDDRHHLAPGYNAQVLIRHGDPIRAGGPAFRPGQQTGAEQEQQFGADNDFLAYMPLPRGSSSSTRGLLGVNHENHRAALSFPGFKSLAQLTREQCEVQMAAQGFSIIEIEKQGQAWRLVEQSPYNRRISTNTEMRISGPAAGHPRMRTAADASGTRVFGTFNNCAGGTTPWGTILTAEENVQIYFAGNAAQGPEAASRRRYNITGRNARYEAWGRHFERFNLDKEPNEPNRFGWIVEIDPHDPRSTPVKRTALGRAAHECATQAVSHDGRVAFYSGDDARMEYVYKFVTEGRFDRSRPEANRDLLDRGTLYVARFEANGKMRWLPLVHGQGPLTAANGLHSQADVVIDARHAGDLVGATPMDRPEDVEAHPVTGRVYVVLTFNEARKPDQLNPANPRPNNKFGHIIEIVPPLVNGRPDHAATECDWGFFLLGGNPAEASHGARYGGPVSASGWVAAPDNVAFDPKGRIWISTDGQDDAAGFNDSLYAAAVSGPERGVTRAFFNGPRGSEICGPEFTPDGKTLFLSVQHPGDEKGSTFDKPSTRWPDFTEGVPPRSAVLAITRSDGGDIGG